MTNKEFLLQIISREQPIFIKIIKAVPADKYDFKVNEKSRTAESLTYQLAMQPVMMSLFITAGTVDAGAYKEEKLTPEQMAKSASDNFEGLKKDLANISDSDWEQQTAALVWPGGKWEQKKYEIVWGFLFDAIHHRGQLSTFLRAMGEKVPNVYGGSADEPMGA